MINNVTQYLALSFAYTRFLLEGSKWI